MNPRYFFLFNCCWNLFGLYTFFFKDLEVLTCSSASATAAVLLIQFDYLKSLEIEEKINKIRWCQTANGALFLLSTNDKTIKFWKVEWPTAF